MTRLALTFALVSLTVFAAPITDDIPDPQLSPFGRSHSPSGIFSFWLSPGLLGDYVPVMDGPDGLLVPSSALPVIQVDQYFDALVDDAGLAVLAYSATGDPGLMAFSYAETSSFLRLNAFKKADGSQFIPVHVWPFITPVSLANQRYTAILLGEIPLPGGETEDASWTA